MVYPLTKMVKHGVFGVNTAYRVTHNVCIQNKMDDGHADKLKVG